jgi:transglutaminase-like putative cysteine protease
MDNYRGTILHQLENLRTGKTEKITHSFLVTNYAVETKVKASQVKPWSATSSPLYLMYTASDPIVPSNDKDIALAAASIIKKEKNPYTGAELIYTWLATNMTYRPSDNPNRSLLVSLAQKSGDSYDLALLFASLARASGIPAIPVAGILVDGELGSRVHWWAEFYVEKLGWIPVDPGLAMETKEIATHFGQLGMDHIAFSRGWNEQKAMTQKSRIVFRTRSFAFQPIWEESGGNIKSYTSFWSNPTVTGVY